jgi:predicted nucleotidyltransferase
METSIKIQELKRRVVAVLKRHDVKRAAVFGSFARGETKKNSDIDILVEFEGKKSLFDLVELEVDLEKALGRKVDVLTYNSLHPLLKDVILNEQKVIL